MFRGKFSESTEQEFVVVAVVSPLYKNMDDLIDDLISTQVGILKITKKRMTDSEVYEWLLEKADSEFGAQFSNGESTILLLKRKNAVECIQKIIDLHNQISTRKSGKKALYSSQNIIDAIRDAKIFFKKDVDESEMIIEATRAYVESHLSEALACQLAEQQILQKRKRDSFNGKEI